MLKKLTSSVRTSAQVVLTFLKQKSFLLTQFNYIQLPKRSEGVFDKNIMFMDLFFIEVD